MRTLLARRASTGEWFQRVDTGEALVLATFAEQVARQFGWPVADVAVEERSLPDAASYTALKVALASGTFESAAVVAAPLRPDRRAALRDRLDAATTLAELRDAVKEALKL